MQAQELLRSFHLPDLDEFGQFLRSLPTSALVGIGTLAAVLGYWLATRPRAITPPCHLQRQSEEVQVGPLSLCHPPHTFSGYSDANPLLTTPQEAAVTNHSIPIGWPTFHTFLIDRDDRTVTLMLPRRLACVTLRHQVTR